MIVGGLILGAVLSAPGAAGHTTPDTALTDPFASTMARGSVARNDEALGLREPFDRPRRAMNRRGKAQRADLREPFDAKPRRSGVAAPPVLPKRADLRSPFGARPPGQLKARPRGERPASAKADLRDPFGG